MSLCTVQLLYLQSVQFKLREKPSYYRPYELLFPPDKLESLHVVSSCTIMLHLTGVIPDRLIFR